MHTSTPSFASRRAGGGGAQGREPAAPASGIVGAAVAVAPGGVAAGGAGARLRGAQRVRLHDAGGRAGAAARATSRGSRYRGDGRVAHTPGARRSLEDMDALPFVTPVYKRDLTVEHYAIGYLQHPYVSLYTGRGCRSKCTFCLWPQTVGGHRYRMRSADHVAAEMALAAAALPAGAGVLLRRRHVHRRPAARRGHRAAARAARHHLVVQRQGQRARTRRSRSCGTTACGCCWSATSRATSGS